MEDNHKISYLSRCQEMKKCYIQLGKRYNIPYELIKYIYNHTRKVSTNEMKKLIIYHNNMIIFKLITSPFDQYDRIEYNKYDKQIERIRTWKKKYDSINGWDGFNNDILFQYRIPDGKGCEWAINKSPIRKVIYKDDNYIFLDIREKIIIELKILSEENYLWERNEVDGSLTPAKIKLKIKYLNKSPFNEIYEDYDDFLTHKGTEEQYIHCLVIDRFGEASCL